uniref:sugar ABC transporter substrate-binding protein n=1 Tax=Herbidospora sakaeratensis TaxID=564415 RepID=UPI0007833FAB|nr:sugar ABC transporter substrate-binding protein [Herbidospora sakaeratensis]
MKRRSSVRADLFKELAISLISGLILAAGASLLPVARPGSVLGSIPLWVYVATAATLAALLAFLVANRLRRGRQAFVMISAIAETRWLADLLSDLSRALDRHGVDLVVKLPVHDHTGRSQLQCLDSLRRERRSYMGGFMVVDQLHRMPQELSEACRHLRHPVVFLDRDPFADEADFPPRTAFVGTDPAEIGEMVANLLAKHLIERGVRSPSVLVIAGDAQGPRAERFETRFRELMPSARIETSTQGQFVRERAREITLARLARGGPAPDAIFCTNDEMALGAADAVQSRSPAADPMIIGVDGIPEALAAIGLGTGPFRGTAVQDTRRMAEVAVDALMRLRAGERPPTRLLVPTSLYPLS